MFNIEKFKEELSKYGLTLETYDKIITDIDSKIDGENDYDWSEIKEKYGINCNSDTIRKSSSTPFGGKMRSEYEKYKTRLNQNVSENSELDVKIQELRREKIKLSDARVEYNKLIRQEARKESYADMVKRIICENVEPMNIPVHYTLFNSSTDLLVHLTDIHTGIEIHNWKNDFDEDILKKRIEEFTSDTKVIQSGCVSGADAYAMSIRKTNKPEQTVSVIGDNGLICLYDIQLD